MQAMRAVAPARAVARPSAPAAAVMARAAGSRAPTRLNSVQTVEAPTQAKTLQSAEVAQLYARVEARAKAAIALEEQQSHTRPMVRFQLTGKIGLGEVWKVVGSCPELGNMQPALAPRMQWTEGDVWVLETRIRPGVHLFKAVLRNFEGAYLWEAGNDRDVIVTTDHNENDLFTIDLDPTMPYELK